MASSLPLFIIIFIFIFIFIFVSSSASQGETGEIGRGSRSLLSFKESPKGGNSTYECSPSGACVSCLYSEKKDEKYRCSETGYRIPLKCIETSPKEMSEKKNKKSRSTLENSSTRREAHGIPLDTEVTSIKHRRLLDGSSTVKGGRQVYITYRSCIPAVNEEKLSVVGFEVIMFCLLLVSAPVIYLRRKQTVAMSGVGAVRVQTNSRY